MMMKPKNEGGNTISPSEACNALLWRIFSFLAHACGVAKNRIPPMAGCSNLSIHFVHINLAQTKAKKESLVDELKKLFEKASILVFVNFHGLSVAKERKLRGEFRKNEIKYKVAKKTLLKRVFDALGLKEVPKLEGEVGVAAGYGEVTEVPRIISQFIKKEKEGLKILGGIYEANFVDDAMIKRLASIPSREILLTQFAFILSQPVASLARALSKVSEKLSANK